jgi:hypothetical protein
MTAPLTPAELARIDQDHAAAMDDLDKFVDMQRTFVAGHGPVIACAVLAESILAWQAAGDPGWTPELVAILAAQAVTKLAVTPS